MYAAYWNLKDNPFLNVVDQRYLFSGEQHEEAMARLSFLAENGRLAGILTGPYGVGKSTVLRHVAAAASSRQRIPVIYMDVIPGGQLPMTRQILSSMKIEGPTQSLPEALMNFWLAVQNRPETLVRTLLCLDEAHYLSTDDGLYLVHYLTNLRLPPRRNHSEEPLFTVILAGTPELLPAVQADPSLAQRMQIVYDLSPLTPAQTTGYIQHHMRAVGGDLWVFNQEALDALYRYSQGLPRKINLLCDVSLMLGFAAQSRQVTAAIVGQAAHDTGLATSATLKAPKEVTP